MIFAWEHMFPGRTKSNHGSLALLISPKMLIKLWITVSLEPDSLIRSGVAQKSCRFLLSLTTTYSASTEECAVIT
jgi:hypothetical protein